ncbi:MAG: diaminopropionate ammonia-lyase [Candidatus Latescibacteria bacterium]|nr:diaminopropionate ammonia-lyase [Candidatus Latescibacterota bacterium]NIM21820.1 diaminopropionate ammonia-lyase [Candidatus Latescibacterota bacterium]NIM65958.1 diaminopropionate ammonia-lyase [Candidatus Latescibacterota bacterium]NIO02703.1 diaminopropionate ammonia-lyase [Candidatus Latescibacterota bacterium]NIO29684.1 diaminopropionate ammonia-lyase [Candidatus Latescibacterota bacterium]
MNEQVDISYVANPRSRRRYDAKTLTKSYSPSVASSVRAFHRSIPRYKPTPLTMLPHLAYGLQVNNIWVKDESYRFCLNAFKILGASYAMAHLLAEKLGLRPESLAFDQLLSEPCRKKLQDITVATATDGNHGRAVAWMAKQIGCKSVVYMPQGTSRSRYDAVKSHGAKTIVIDGSYDEAVRLARSKAEEHGWLLIQDSAWEGYEEIPTLIMQGYLTILNETLDQLEGETPTHVFVQCGVGSLAASLQAYLYELFGRNRPLLAVVEPSQAACFHESMRNYDGKPKKATGDLSTAMAGLACGEPSLLAWNILRDYADVFVSCPDYLAINGMRILGKPVRGDERIISGESGAVTLGMLAHVRTHLENAEITNILELSRHSRILLISTEGDTNPEAYRKIVWEEDF